MSEENEALEVLKGVLLLTGCNVAAGFLIFGVGLAVGMQVGNYVFLNIWVIGGLGFLFWQLLWVIPLTLWLRKKGYIGMMKGVILGAVVTALLNGTCFLAFFATGL